MEKYVELKNCIVKKMCLSDIVSDNDIVNVYDIVKKLEVDLQELKKIQKCKNKIEDTENAITVFEYILKNIKYKRLDGIDDISLEIKNVNGTSYIKISYQLDEVIDVIICKDINDTIYFDIDKSVDSKYLHHTKKILLKYENEFKQIFSLLSKYSTKYDCDIENGSFVRNGEPLLLQHIDDEIFNIDIFVENNFDVNCQFSFNIEKDPDAIFNRNIARYIPLNDIIINNMEYLLKKISIARTNINPIINIESNISKKVKKIEKETYKCYTQNR